MCVRTLRSIRTHWCAQLAAHSSAHIRCATYVRTCAQLTLRTCAHVCCAAYARKCVQRKLHTLARICCAAFARTSMSAEGAHLVRANAAQQVRAQVRAQVRSTCVPLTCAAIAAQVPKGLALQLQRNVRAAQVAKQLVASQQLAPQVAAQCAALQRKLLVPSAQASRAARCSAMRCNLQRKLAKQASLASPALVGARALKSASRS